MGFSNKISLSRSIIFIVTSIGFIGAIITIYAFFIQQRNIELQYEILSNTNILDIKADVNQFDILYDGKSLKATNENVRIITLRILNSGNTDILKDYYDDDAPLGFKVTNGLLLKEPELIGASNNYLKDNLIVKADSSNKIFFSKIILETSEYFIIKVIVKYTLKVTPSIVAIGKVAGIKSIQVVNTFEQKESESFFSKVFSGNILIQLVRGFAYSLMVIILGITIAFSVSSISEYRNKIRRKKLVERFKFEPKYNYNKMDDALFNRFIEDDIDILRNMRRFVKDEKYLNSKYKFALIREKRENRKPEFISKYEIDSYYYEKRINRTYYIIEKMITDGLVIKTDNSLKINSSMKNTLEQFIPFLNENNYIIDYVASVSDEIQVENDKESK